MTKNDFKGPTPMTIKSEVLEQAGSSIFYDVIPYEMIYTKEDLP